MCVFSMVIDQKCDDWTRRYYRPAVLPPRPFVPLPSPTEIDEFRRLLDRARKYDRDNNQPDCEMEEKRQKIKKLANELGVPIDFLE
jgi:hypothetical protein